MKILGIIILVIGILSLIGGLISPSGANISVVVLGYVFKFALIIGGIVLISRNTDKVRL